MELALSTEVIDQLSVEAFKAGNQIFAKFSKSFTSTNKKNSCKKLKQ